MSHWRVAIFLPWIGILPQSPQLFGGYADLLWLQAPWDQKGIPKKLKSLENQEKQSILYDHAKKGRYHVGFLQRSEKIREEKCFSIGGDVWWRLSNRGPVMQSRCFSNISYQRRRRCCWFSFFKLQLADEYTCFPFWYSPDQCKNYYCRILSSNKAFDLQFYMKTRKIIVSTRRSAQV